MEQLLATPTAAIAINTTDTPSNGGLSPLMYAVRKFENGSSFST